MSVPHLQAGDLMECLLPIQDLTNHCLQQRDSQLPADLCWQLGVGKHHLASINPAAGSACTAADADKQVSSL